MEKANTAIFYFSVLPRKNKCFLVNLKYMTVTWLFKMAKFMWVNFESLCNANLTVDVTLFFALLVLIFRVCLWSFQCYIAVRRI